VRIEPGDILTVDGEVVNEREPTRLWRYHKPVGLLTTHSDPGGRPTVFQNLPEGLPRVISVGRLDLNSEGLLLLTNDGALARALELPKSGWIRRYRVRAYGRTSQDKLDELKKGVTVEGVHYGAIEARLDKVTRTNSTGGANLWITVAISEGKNREVRRVMESIGLKVNRLIRLAYGPFALAQLPEGAVEEVGPRVIRELLADFIPPENMPKGDRTGALLLPEGAKARRNPTEAKAKGAGPAAGAAPGRASGRPAPVEPAKPKKVYKAGWAKAKPRTGPKPSPKKGAAPRGPGKPSGGRGRPAPKR
jgi:23S rRNA pseudouridine2605 synthase